MAVGDRGGKGTHGGWDDGQDPLEPTEQLPLDDHEDRLPWLEASDDEEDDYSGGGAARLLGLAAGGLFALVAVFGVVWWVAHRGSDAALIADGSTIKAPTTPYKVAPANPGGKTFEGTGDTSFAVSEGQSRPAKLGGSDAALAPASAVPAPSPSATPGEPKPAAGPAAAKAGGVGVQVGAYSSQALAEAGWSKLVTAHQGALSGVSHRVIVGKADIGTVYRLQAVAADAAAANALCGNLKAAGVACQVK